MAQFQLIKQLLATLVVTPRSRGFSSAVCGGLVCLGLVLSSPPLASARELPYAGEEVTIYTRPGEPTEIDFRDGKVKGGYKRAQSSITVDKKESKVVIFTKPTLTVDGEALIITLEDNRSYAIRVLPADGEQKPRDSIVTIVDERAPDYEQMPDFNKDKKTGSSATTVPGLMRELVLVAEFGKRLIPGYRRSNRFAGETVLNDGAVNATIKEMFLGPDLWGYVIEVENLLGTTQRLNHATFRLDGTKAVSFQYGELAPRPETSEQMLAKRHVMNVYVITRAKRS